MTDSIENPGAFDGEFAAASASDIDFDVIETPAAKATKPTSAASDLSDLLASFTDPNATEDQPRGKVGKDDTIEAGAIPEDGDTDREDELVEWTEELVYMGKKKDFLAPSSGNIRVILMNCAETRDAFAWCEMRKRPVITRDVHFKIYGLAPLRHTKGSRGTPVTDDMLDNLMGYFQAKSKRGGGGGWEMMLRIEELRRGISQAAQNRRFHPVREFLGRLPEWDGEKRLEKVFVKYLKTPDNDYFRQAARLAFVGAVARALEPGCRFHLMFILEGVEGIKKSSFIEQIGSRFYGEVSDGSMSKTTTWIESTRSLWFVEFPELSAWKGVNSARVTALMTTAVDRARMVWDTEESEYARGFVIWGTSNNRSYLTAKAGNRRYVPIPVGLQVGEEIDFDELASELDQIWAEALHVYYGMVIDRWHANVAKEEEKAKKRAKSGQADQIEKPTDWEELNRGDLPLVFTGKAAEYARRFQASRRIEDDVDTMGNEIASGIAAELVKADEGAKSDKFWNAITIDGITVLAKARWCIKDIAIDILSFEKEKESNNDRSKKIGSACDLIPWFESTGLTERLPWQKATQRTLWVKNPRDTRYLQLVREAMVDKGWLAPLDEEEDDRSHELEEPVEIEVPVEA